MTCLTSIQFVVKKNDNKHISSRFFILIEYTYNITKKWMFKIWLPDCGIPSNEAYSMEKVKEWDGIGITRGMHITCSLIYAQQGSELFVCLSNGYWRKNLSCTLKRKKQSIEEF